MKQTLLLIAVAGLSAQSLSAQTVAESKLTDNWYFGATSGLNFKTTHTSVLDNINLSAGLRVGKNFTPVVGMAIEGVAYMNNKGSNFRPLGTFIKGINVSALATTNFSNWFYGYKGEPRSFEVVGVYGLGWGHIFSTSSAPIPGRNTLTSKLGLDFVMNMGENKSWQIYIEPNITYALSDWDNNVQFDLNQSAIGLLVGFNYKLKNSNGTYSFAVVDIPDESEIALLNDRINILRAENMELANVVDERNKTIYQLRDKLDKPVVETVVMEDEVDVLQPVVVFKQGQCVIAPEQYANISLIARYMQDNPGVNVVIKGYASVEGGKEHNQKLSEKRAEAVKQALQNRYNISSNRLVVKGLGSTDNLFEERELNRVVIFAGE